MVADLSPDAIQLQMLSVAAALKEIGYEIQVLSWEKGEIFSNLDLNWSLFFSIPFFSFILVEISTPVA